MSENPLIPLGWSVAIVAAVVYVSLWVFAGWDPLSVGSWFDEEDCPPGYYRDVVGEDRWRGEIYGCVRE